MNDSNTLLIGLFPLQNYTISFKYANFSSKKFTITLGPHFVVKDFWGQKQLKTSYQQLIFFLEQILSNISQILPAAHITITKYFPCGGSFERTASPYYHELVIKFSNIRLT